MNVHMKNTQIKYKLNFKTMKKGLLTVLAASLVFVGCQNYDDQFDDLNAQISALKSQVDGLSSLSGQVASLSGTISGLQAGVSAAQASAASAAAAASAITTTPATDVSSLATAAELATLSASLATLDAAVAAVQASLADTATAAAVTTLQAEIDAIEADLDDLLATSNIYSTAISVTNATTLNAALALGNKINVLNAALTITGYSGMSYTDVQTLVDRINTMTGAITYTAYSAAGTAIVFNNLTSVGNITMTQPGSYSFPKLTNAAVIDMKDDYETTVTSINFPLLTTVTGLQTDATADTIEFTYATSVDLGSLATAPSGGSDALTITTKKDATLDLGSWVAIDTAGSHISFTLTLNGPASFTNGTAAGTFASTGLPGNTLGAHDGTISLTNVATATIYNFRGTVTLSTGVKNFTGTNIVAAGISGATDLETLSLDLMRDNDPANSAAVTAALSVSSATGQDHALVAGHAKLTSATITGDVGDISATAVPSLTTLNLASAAAFDVSVSGNVSLTSFTDAATAEDWTFDNNDEMTSLVSAHATSLTVTGDTAVSVSVSGNALITSLTLSADDVDVLNITSNAVLATIAGGTNMADNGTSTTTNVDIHQNALVASLVRDSKESPSATVVAGAASDTGAITTASGIKDLDTYLASAKASTGIVSVWFDTVTKLEIQATYGGSYTDTTGSVTAPTAWDDTTAAANAVLRQSGTYAGIYAYMFSRDASAAVTATTGARTYEAITWTYDVGRNAASYSEKALASNEGFTVAYTGGTATFKQGDAYASSANGSTVASVDDLVAYMNADTTLDGLGVDIQADRAGFERTLLTMSFTQSTGSAQVAGLVSGTGNIAYYMTTTETGANSIFVHPAADNDGSTEIMDDVKVSLNASGDLTAADGTNANQLLVSRHISGGTSVDNSPVAVNVAITPIIDAAMASTSVILLDNAQVDYGTTTGGSANSAGVISNTGAQASSLFAFDITETALSGIRITLKNSGSLLFAQAVTVYGTVVSNTAITTAATAQAGSNGGLVLGTSAPTYANDNDIGAYMTTFANITSGTTTTTTAAVTAVDTDRTGW